MPGNSLEPFQSSSRPSWAASRADSSGPSGAVAKSTKAMLPTPYPELNLVLQAFVAGIQQPLADDLIGAYLQGSFAIGGFDEHSDVDFVVIIRDELTDLQVSCLQDTHARVFDLQSEWAKHLEGSYIPLDRFRGPPGKAPGLWYLDHGAHSLIRSCHCDTLVVRWTAREKGIVLVGPSPDTLIAPISPPALRNEIFNTIAAWGQEILQAPARFNNRFYQGFILLSYCRMLHDLHTGYPGSKAEGAEWAKATMDPSWAALIDRAWATRPDPARSVREPADAGDFAETLRFVELVVAESQPVQADISKESSWFQRPTGALPGSSATDPASPDP